MNSSTELPILERSTAVVVIETFVITLVTAMILFGNLLIIVLLKSFTCWEDNTCLLLQNLALTDFGVGATLTLFAIYPSAMSLSQWPYGLFMCKLSSYLGEVCCSASIITLALVSIERYIFIIRPLKYHKYITRRRLIFAIILSWSLPIVLHIATFSNMLGTIYNVNSFLCSSNFPEHLGYTITVLVVVFLPANTTIIYTYSCIVSASYRHSRQIHTQQAPPNTNRFSVINHKAICTFLMITGMFNLAWLPYSVLALLRGLLPSTYDFPHWVEFLLPWLAMSNSFVNVFIYLVFNPPIRKHVKKTFNFKMCFNTVFHENL